MQQFFKQGGINKLKNESKVHIRQKTILKIILLSFAIKVVILLLVQLFSPNFGFFFMNDGVFHDDDKYFIVARDYLSNSTSIFDIVAFRNATNLVGHYSQYSSENLWFWTVSIFAYIFKWLPSLNFLVILISSINIYLIYYLGKKFYSIKTGILAAKLYAFMPYPLIFSVFIFKDHLIITAFLFFLLFLFSLFYEPKIKFIHIFVGLLGLILFSQLRQGLSDILILITIIAFGYRLIKRQHYSSFIAYSILSIATLIILLSISDNLYSSVIYKINAYVNYSRFDDTSLSLIGMNRLSDIYKFPATYVVSIIMPFNLGQQIDSWFNLVSYINIISIPIASGLIIYMIINVKKRRLLYWVVIFITVGTLFVSLAIFRHYFFLLPIHYLFFSEFIREKKQRDMWLLSSIFLLIGLVIFTLM